HLALALTGAIDSALPTSIGPAAKNESIRIRTRRTPFLVVWIRSGRTDDVTGIEARASPPSRRGLPPARANPGGKHSPGRLCPNPAAAVKRMKATQVRTCWTHPARSLVPSRAYP